MKKTVIIFMMVFCLLLFVGIYSLAKEPSRSPGEVWNTSSVTVKTAWVLGFGSGIAMSLMELVPTITTIEELSDRGKVCTKLVDLADFFVRGHRSAIRNVMTDLYKDHANTYIPWASMFEVACRKLKGEDVEPLLQKARKEAVLRHNK